MIAAVQQQELAEIASRSAEAAIKNAESVLKSGELYRLLAENFPNGMVLLFDHDLRHILAGGKGLAALGLSKEALEGKTLWEGFVPPACRRMEPLYRAALAGESVVSDVRFPVGEALPGRTERVYQVHTLPVMDDLGKILIGMVVAQDVTEQRQAEETIRRQAHHDALTGLPNRVLLLDRLSQILAKAERSGEIAALLFLDLDDFKHINDTLGHAAGDLLLKTVAERLSGCLRAEDTVARMGGDEFVVLLPSLPSAEDAARVAEKISAGLAAPLTIEDHAISVTVSIGIGLFPFDGHDGASLMRYADDAMYHSKKTQSS